MSNPYLPPGVTDRAIDQQIEPDPPHGAESGCPRELCRECEKQDEKY